MYEFDIVVVDQHAFRGEKTERVAKVAVEQLQTGMREFTTAFGEVIRTMEAECGNYAIGEVTVTVSVSASGKVALLGNGVSAGLGGTIAVKFTRTIK
jgi:hypothetical protein